MEAHIEIQIHLKLGRKESLHAVLRAFAERTKGWQFPEKQSREYQDGHKGAAGFVVCASVNGLEPATVAIANLNSRYPNSFSVSNIVPRETHHLTLCQYNAI